MALVFKRSIEFSNLISISASGLHFEEGNVPSCFTQAVGSRVISSSLRVFFRLPRWLWITG